MNLHEKKCKSSEGEVSPLSNEEIKPLHALLNQSWEVVNDHHLHRNWEFNDFATALVFLNSAALICEEEFHHADFEISWGRVSAVILTHSLDGLTEADFILASKFDRI
tara:strand:+ start:284 stop:607 length:324 start_codon:yes stop_codon:yes gene_type:complete